MADPFNFYPGVDKNNNFPAPIRKALAESPEVAGTVSQNSKVIAAAAALAQSDQGLVRTTDVRLSATPEPAMVDDETIVYSVTDANNRRSWLEVNSAGRPSELSTQLIKEALNISDDATVNVRTVKPDGTGDYTSLRLANAGITDASAANPYVVKVYPGDYTADKGEDNADANSWIPKDYISFIGLDRDRCVVRWNVAVETPNSELVWQSGMWIRHNTRLENLTIIIDGGQYAVHDEGAGLNVGIRHELVNVRFVHKGYDAMNAWRAANGVAPYVGAMNAYGWGSASGLTAEFDGCYFESPWDPFLMHNNEKFADPTKAVIRNSVFTSGSEYAGGITLNSLGSGTADTIDIYDSELNVTYIQDIDASYSLDTVANHSDIRARLFNCTPVGYNNATRGLALRVQITYDDNDLNSGIQSLTGPAADLLFGKQNFRPLKVSSPVYKNGMHGFAFGTVDVSGNQLRNGLLGRTLGARLGDCRTATKDLLVTGINGWAKQMTFDQDYRSMTNSQVLDILNSVLAPGFYWDLWNPSLNEVYPQMGGHEVALRNGGTYAIQRFAPVAYADPSRRSIRLMAANDPVSSFAGVALQRIADGSVGRILRRGLLNSSQLFGFNTAIGDKTPIYFADEGPARGFAPTGTRLAMTGGANGWAYFDATRN